VPRSQRIRGTKFRSHSRSRSWSQSREDADKAARLSAAATVAVKVAAMVAAAAAVSSATYPAGARLCRASTDGSALSRNRAERGGRPLSPCACRLLCCRAEPAAPRRPPAPREGARRRLHPPPPALRAPSFLLPSWLPVSSAAARRWGSRP
jgi:hypothetical protein